LDLKKTTRAPEHVRRDRVRSKFAWLFRAGNIYAAETLLVSSQDILPPKVFARMQADVLLAKHSYRDLLEQSVADDGLGADPRLRIARARAYLALGSPENAALCLGKIPPVAANTTQVKFLRMVAFVDRGRLDDACLLATKLFADQKSERSLKRRLVRLFLRAGLVSQATDFLKAALVTDDAVAVLKGFIDGCLQTGRADLILAQAPAIDQYWLGLSRRISVSALTIRDAPHCSFLFESTPKDALLSTVKQTLSLIKTKKAAFQITKSLLEHGDSAVARDCLALFLRLGDADARDFSADQLATNKFNADQATLARWLAVAPAERQIWEATVRRRGVRTNRLDVDIHSSAEKFNAFAASIKDGDWTKVKSLADNGKPAILASTHVGVLMGLFAQLIGNGVAARIMGGNLISTKLLPSGEKVFVPLYDLNNSTEIARKTVGLLESGTVIALTADATRNVRKCVVDRDGFQFQLPDAIPKMAYRYKVPVFWVCVYWRETGLVCDVERAPSPLGGEGFEVYRERWFTYFIEKVRAVGMADARNVRHFANIRPLPNRENTTPRAISNRTLSP